MRLDRIDLSWFRGAADPVALETRGKSIVVYGENGSGKSSFVDAVEYILCDGRVDHLAHEYSGKRQEKAIPNTHTPKDRACELQITLQDRSAVKVRIQHDGKAERTGSGATSVENWDYRRTVLRQHEVSAFIHGSKTEKFSALLPLLGLHSLEQIADNLRTLSTAIEDEAQLTQTTYKLAQLATQRRTTFGSATDDEIAEQVRTLHATYCPDRAATVDSVGRCKDLATALQARLDSSSADQRLHVALQDLGAVAFEESIESVRSANATLASETEPLIRERVDVLNSARTYAERLGPADEVSCPACGRSIEVGGLREHVETEHARLQGIIQTTALRAAAIDTLVQSITTLRATLGKEDLKRWKDSVTAGPHAHCIPRATSFDTAALRANCTEADLKSIERDLVPLVTAAKTAATNAPPEVKQLAHDKRLAEAASPIFAAAATEQTHRRAQSLVLFINALERGAREEILSRTKAVIDTISTDVRMMWAILHPDEPIEGVRLYVPRDGDRAIEIGLKFHGVEQESPRLTLSEGYRNSLGLCIFLAMAKRETAADRPVLLDDVVVSLDRNHRGMVVDLLDKDFGGRQVLLFTHDRDWYTELRQQLDNSRWQFKALMPWESPTIGIRWSEKTTTFADARAHLAAQPDSAGAYARKIMDVELAIIAERLQILVPYVRADKNDKRMAHDLLVRIVGAGQTCFEAKNGTGWTSNSAALAVLDHADRLLVSWGNRASHTTDLVRPEAKKLIDACEAALETFTCSSCSKPVWYAEAGGSPELVQCQCGGLRWRYGKQ
jgi:energy-coupling factor transporter ATP-binding protein EcfA2